MNAMWGMFISFLRYYLMYKLFTQYTGQTDKWLVVKWHEDLYRTAFKQNFAKFIIVISFIQNI